ncbi:MAG TPA: hypothetical protein PKD59_07735 [Miltoncostaeaceae bacterium]|nr:hypothetical protein [Miltoncostaeaceae bacterium]
MLVVLVAIAAPSSRTATSWHYFHDAARLLVSGAAPGGGLDLYLAHPEFQFGPITAAVAVPPALLPDAAGRYGAIIIGTLLGVVALVAVERTVAAFGIDMRRRGPMYAVRAGEVALAIVWTDVAVGTAHLDDAIALASATVACAAIAERRPTWVPVAALAISASAKPWAIVFAPLVLAAGGGRRPLRLVVVVSAAALTWLPFVLDEPGTISAAGSFTIANAPSSALRVLGVTDPTTPIWVRPVQFALGSVMALVLVRRGRWPAVPMAGMAIRLMLDPGVHHYYAAGLVAAVLVWEATARPGRLPCATLTTAVLMEVTPTLVQPSALAGSLRLVLTGALIVAAFSHPQAMRRVTSPPGNATRVDAPGSSAVHQEPRSSGRQPSTSLRGEPHG